MRQSFSAASDAMHKTIPEFFKRKVKKSERVELFFFALLAIVDIYPADRSVTMNITGVLVSRNSYS